MNKMTKLTNLKVSHVNTKKKNINNLIILIKKWIIINIFKILKKTHKKILNNKIKKIIHKNIISNSKIKLKIQKRMIVLNILKKLKNKINN